MPVVVRIYSSVELDEALYRAACDRFSGEPSVTVIHGDSYAELGGWSRLYRSPVSFGWMRITVSSSWAEGPHDPPLPWEPPSIVARRQRDVIVIDDARLVGVNPGYAFEIDQVQALVYARASSFEVRRDIIRIVLDAADASVSAVTS